MRSVLTCVTAVLLLAGCSFGPSARFPVTASSTNDAAEAAALISAYRASKGLGPVTVSANLNRAAEHQARVVAAAGDLSHGDFGGRMGDFGIMGHAAENLSAGRQTVSEAVTSWKESSSHNRNMLLPQSRSIGLARADSSGGYRRYWALVLGSN
jgi:uncharacterized protein YkwD